MARFPTLGPGDKVRDKHLPDRLTAEQLEEQLESVGDSRYGRVWVAGEVVTAGSIRTAPAPYGGSISRIADGTARQNYDATERALWAPVSAPAFPTTGITYDGSGNVQTVTENGVTTTYTYNADGSVASDSRAGVTRTYTYDGSGNLTGIAS